MIPNGIYTFTNAAGEHRTFKIKTQPEDSKFMPGKRIAALLSGPDNESDYTGFAFVNDTDLKIWNKKNTPAFRYYGKMLSSAAELFTEDAESVNGKIQIEGRVYEVQASKRCLVCNRTLTDPESIKLQIGPICREGRAA